MVNESHYVSIIIYIYFLQEVIVIYSHDSNSELVPQNILRKED